MAERQALIVELASRQVASLRDLTFADWYETRGLTDPWSTRVEDPEDDRIRQPLANPDRPTIRDRLAAGSDPPTKRASARDADTGAASAQFEGQSDPAPVQNDETAGQVSLAGRSVNAMPVVVSTTYTCARGS